MDLDAYRAEAEAFASAIAREHYLHYSGRQRELAIEPIYERHSGLFSRAAVDGLREAGNPELLEFAVEGLIGRATRTEQAELAAREAALELDVGDPEPMPFRHLPVAQANERDPDRRAALEAVRQEATERDLNPLLQRMLERSRELVEELGWPDMATMCAELSGIDLQALGRSAEAFLAASEDLYEDVVGPSLAGELGFGFERVRRSDLPAFFRARSLDARFPADRLIAALEDTLADLGIDAGGRVIVDADERPTKSPRAFCAGVRVPDEVYLVIAPHGGRDDFEALLHEAGHAQHYAHVDAALSFEHRYLGDNSLTESYAFLFQRLAAEPAWLGRHLDVEDADDVAAHARATKLAFLRRYAAKLGYELELHAAAAGQAPPQKIAGSYARRLSRALHLEWPGATWLSDVDPFFYAARYLRAWALEARLAGVLRERFGPAWFAEREAGALLEALWADGQGTTVEAVLARLDSRPREPDLLALLEELVPAA